MYSVLKKKVIIPFIGNVPNRQIYRHRLVADGCLSLGGFKVKGTRANGYGFSLGIMQVFENCGDGCTSVTRLKPL